MKSDKYSTFTSALKWATSHKKGSLGLLILILFLLIAIFADFIAPHKPDELGLADGLAVPIWLKSLPEYRNLPENVVIMASSNNWNIKSSEGLQLQRSNQWLICNISTNENYLRKVIFLEYPFNYSYSPPRIFEGKLPFTVSVYEAPGSYARLQLYIETPSGRNYEIFDSGSIAYNKSMIDPPARFDARDVSLKLMLGFAPDEDVGEKIFAEEGTYHLRLVLTFVVVNGSTLKVAIGPLYFRILGLAYGLLGTDNLGADLFSNLIYGTRVSLLVGVMASVISVSIGLVVGLVSGYKGGIVDQILMFFTDTLLFMPVIPLLVAVSVFVGKNLYLTISLIALLSWMGFARNCRSYVMSLRDRLFVESAKALGASDIYIIFRHILPQLTPIVYITLVMNVPGAILLEASLSFLNLGDPSIPSWGRMLYNAYYSGAFFRMVWWWIIPPGLMIALLAMSFVLIGQTLDEVFNPKLRARR